MEQVARKTRLHHPPPPKGRSGDGGVERVGSDKVEQKWTDHASRVRDPAIDVADRLAKVAGDVAGVIGSQATAGRFIAVGVRLLQVAHGRPHVVRTLRRLASGLERES